MAILSRYSCSTDQTSSSPSSHSISNPGKIASRNRSKNLSTSNGRIKSYGPFEPILKVGDQTSASLSDSIAYPSKTASRNPSKNLSAIQQWDQKFWPFSATRHLVRSTRQPRHRVGIPYIPHEKQPLETPVKI
jgi:hypothetical protein